MSVVQIRYERPETMGEPLEACGGNVCELMDDQGAKGGDG
ncbi:MAG: hypothetical protein ACI8TP_001894 [Acidimicrobiales bacterium]|jgi:hypothetical protein